MFLSFNKLREMSTAPLFWGVENMVESFNKLGFEVEGYKKMVNIEGVKFGKVIETLQHPNSDKLIICKIKFEDKYRQIVTSAINAKEGKYIIAFISGSRLGNIIFSTKKIKGINSEGMLSSFGELGFNKGLLPDKWSKGIHIFDEEVNLCDDPIKILGLNDYIIEMNILSNRSDANSYIVLAQELKAYLNTGDFNFPAINIRGKTTDIEVVAGDAELLSISEIKLEDLQISLEEKLLLIKSGIKPQSPFIDLSNLTMIMTGQPVHVYDKKKIGKNITAKISSINTKISGNIDIKFNNSLLINDESKSISAAGIIGFESTDVDKTTKIAIIEIGRFNIKNVRDTAKQIKINSMSSTQSSKKLNIGTQELGWAFISNKSNISEIKGMCSVEKTKIKFEKRKLMQILGEKIDKNIFKTLIEKFEKLGFKYSDKYITIPSYRHDINTQNDINEELLRLYGYDNLKIISPDFITPFIIKNISHKHSEISAMGYQEVWTYSLISKVRNIINPFNFKKTIELKTFVSKERQVIRDSMYPSLLEVLAYNQKRKIEDISIFDIGQINDGILVVGLFSTTKSFNEMKKDIINICNKEIVFKRFISKNIHSGVSAVIKVDDNILGWIGKVHPDFDQTNAFFAEIKLDADKKKFFLYNKYTTKPMKRRDINIVLDIKEDIAQKIEALKKIPFIFKIQKINEFQKNNKKIVTIKIIGSEIAIDYIDEKFN